MCKVYFFVVWTRKLLPLANTQIFYDILHWDTNNLLYDVGYFKGASKAYSENNSRENVNPHPEQSEKVIQKLKQELQIDLEVYNFIVQRFNVQLQHIKSL